MIQTLEDIMRACVIDFGGSYHLSIRCAPFEALYGRKCRSPVLWAEIGGSSLIGPELVQEMIDKVVLVKEKPKAARDRQKRYADKRRKPLEFEVGDQVLLKVSPWKGVVRFGKNDELAPRYVGLFEILERIGPVAYRLRLPEELICVHDTFHVLNLKKCLGNAILHVSLNEIKIDKTYRGPEFTWEREDYMKSKYPQLFVDRAVEPTTCVGIVWKLLVHQMHGLVLFKQKAYLRSNPWPGLRGNYRTLVEMAFNGIEGNVPYPSVEYLLDEGHVLSMLSYGNLLEDKEVRRMLVVTEHCMRSRVFLELSVFFGI
ncbi:hypothetical protein Tco_0053987 [Tanacetum coccineum]